jgi:hypothetical protein
MGISVVLCTIEEGGSLPVNILGMFVGFERVCFGSFLVLSFLVAKCLFNELCPLIDQILNSLHITRSHTCCTHFRSFRFILNHTLVSARPVPFVPMP